MLGERADNDNNVTPRRGAAMRIFIFKSEAKPELRAFGGELDGSKLPKQFRPWRAVGAIAPDRDPPHQLSRDVIEAAIKTQGFQLWRVKDERAPAPAPAGADGSLDAEGGSS
jgi:hypothetical protein